MAATRASVGDKWGLLAIWTESILRLSTRIPTTLADTSMRKSSICLGPPSKEVGILVPLIVYRSADNERYVLMDGERRWRCSIDLGLTAVPANIIETPSRLDNLLRMFNIHNVREDWPLISVALSLQTVIEESNEDRESRLASTHRTY